MAKKSNVQSMIQKAKRNGFTNSQIAIIRQSAINSTKQMQEQATRDAMLCMLAIPLNVLFADHWVKSGKKKAPEFIEECVKLFNAFVDGQVSREEMNEFIWDAAGVRLDEVGVIAKDKGTRRWKKYPEER